MEAAKLENFRSPVFFTSGFWLKLWCMGFEDDDNERILEVEFLWCGKYSQMMGTDTMVLLFFKDQV